MTLTSRVAEFNDLDGLERELAHGDVAAVLMEPALTNIGIVLPEPGYLDGVRELTRRHGTLLINDETHTFSAGPGGAHRGLGPGPGHGHDRQGHRRRHPGRRLRPVRRAGRPDLTAATDLDLVDMGGVGGTLAGNAVSVAATRATLEQVLTDAAFAGMIAVATGVRRRRPQASSNGTACRGRSASSARGSEYRFCRAGAADRRPSRRPPPTPSSRTTCTSTWPTAASC